MEKEYLTWETLPEKKYRIFLSNFGVKDCVISITRDKDFKLIFSLEIPLQKFVENRQKIQNIKFKKRLVGAQNISNKRIYLPSLFILSQSFLDDRVILSGTLKEAYYYIRPKIRSDYYLSHYFLNSPVNFPFPENSSYEETIHVNYSIEKFADDEFIRTPGGQFSRNCIILEINKKKVALVLSLKNNIKGMYLRSKFGETILIEEAETISTVFSFLTSTKLIYLGWAEIHKEFAKHKQYCLSSFEEGIDRLINNQLYYPLPHGFSAYRYGDFNVTQVIQSFLIKYL